MLRASQDDEVDVRSGVLPSDHMKDPWSGSMQCDGLHPPETEMTLDELCEKYK